MLVRIGFALLSYLVWELSVVSLPFFNFSFTPSRFRTSWTYFALKYAIQASSLKEAENSIAVFYFFVLSVTVIIFLYN